MSKETASVEVLTAEVRTLVVGSRQVTMSVYKQLDMVAWNELEPFGRVAAGSTCMSGAERTSVVGRHTETGALVACSLCKPTWQDKYGLSVERQAAEEARLQWMALPKIVLAGLR